MLRAEAHSHSLESDFDLVNQEMQAVWCHLGANSRLPIPMRLKRNMLFKLNGGTCRISLVSGICQLQRLDQTLA